MRPRRESKAQRPALVEALDRRVGHRRAVFGDLALEDVALPDAEQPHLLDVAGATAPLRQHLEAQVRVHARMDVVLQIGELRPHGGGRGGDPLLVADLDETAHGRLLGELPAAALATVYAASGAPDAAAQRTGVIFTVGRPITRASPSTLSISRLAK